MIVVRLLVFLALATAAVSGAFYLFTRDARYLKFAWQILKFGLIFLAVFGALYVLERIVLVV